MSNTTTKLLSGGLTLALCLSPCCAWAGVQSTLPLLLSAAALGDDGRTTVAKAGDLLHEARQAMTDGNYEIAESKLSRAEALQPKYPLIYTGDTPKKVRADLDKLMAQKAGGASKSNMATDKGAASGRAASATADPFLNRTSPPQPSGVKQASGTMPINSGNSAMGNSGSTGSSGMNANGSAAGYAGANGMSGGTNSMAGPATAGSGGNFNNSNKTPSVAQMARSQNSGSAGSGSALGSSAAGSSTPLDLLSNNASRVTPLNPGARPGSANSGYATSGDTASRTNATPRDLLSASGEVGPSVSDLSRMTASPRTGLRSPDGASADSSTVSPARLTQPGSVAADQNTANPWETDVAALSSYSGNGRGAAGAQDPSGMSRADSAAMKKQSATATQSDSMLLEARRLLARNDYRSASLRIDQAKGLGVTYSAMDDSPAKVEALIQKANNLQVNATDNSERSRRLRAEVWMEEAEGLYRWKDYDEAQRLTADVQRLGINYGPFEPKPEQLMQRIVEARRAAGGMINDARQEIAASAASTVELAGAQVDAVTAAAKQRAIDMAKQARAGMAQGQVALAEQLAKQAESLAPDSAYTPDEDRPTFVLLDIQRAKQKVGGTTGNASSNAWPAENSRYPGANAIYNPSTDTTRNVAAGAASPTATAPSIGMPVPIMPGLRPADSAAKAGGSFSPTPENGTGEALRSYRAGLDAVAHGNSPDALNNFRRAYAFQTELDSSTRKQLYDHLKILGEQVDPLPSADESFQANSMMAAGKLAGIANTTQAAVTPAGASETTASALLPGGLAANSTNPSPMPTEIAAPAPLVPNPESAQALVRQISAEVTRQQGLARDMRERQPKQALATLQHTREMVASTSGLDAPARDNLLRRLDASIREMQAYVDKNAPSIELEDRNKKIEQEVNGDRKQKVVVNEKLALIIDDFNKAIDERRWPAAHQLAKKAAELDPDNPVVTQVLKMDKMTSRVATNEQNQSDKEEGFWQTMQEVDRSSVPFSGEFTMPEAKKWKQLIDSPYRRQREGQLRRSPAEQKIEERLSTPISLKFQNRPLSEVLDYFAKVGQVNTYIDPQGLQSEGVLSSTPVTIDLSQDISLKSALKLILEPLHLTYVIKDDVLKITSEDAKHGQFYRVAYPVGDLVIRIPNFSPNGREGINGAFREAYDRMGWSGASGGSGAGGMMMASNDTGTSANATMNPSLLAQMGMPTKGGPFVSTGETRGGSAAGGFGPGGLRGGSQADFDSLIDLITSTIAAPTWSEMGGPGTIQSFETNLSLVVSQTQEVHEQIADLLQQLRRLNDLQVTIEVRFITLQDDFFERIGVDFDFNLGTHTNPLPTPSSVGPPPSFGGNIHPSETVGLDPTGAVTPGRDIQFRQGGFGDAIPAFGGFDAGTAATFGFAILSDIEAFFVVQAAQGDTRSNILQAPKVTLFNGQQATVSDTSQKPFVTSVIPVVGDFAAAQQPVIVVLSEGTSLTVQAVVSNDRRFVRLTVVPFFSQIGDVDTFTFTGSSSSTKKSSESKTGDDASSSSAEDDASNTATTVQLPTFSFVTVTTTVSVPDGGTVLLGGIKRLSEGRNERGVPILSKLPYVNRLFRNVGIGRTTSSLMMMVTPRIIIQEEEAAAIEGGEATP